MRSLAGCHQKGFTMVELLIGTFLASLISLAVFSMFINSSNYYGQQLDQTQAQSNLRFAMEFLKSDFRDLGRMSVMNTDLRVRDQLYCGVRQYQGLEHLDNEAGGDHYQLNQALARNDIFPDRLRALIDVSGATPLYVRNLNGAAITLAPTINQPTIEARRMTGLGAEARFSQLFDDFSLTRVTNLSTGKYDIIPTSDAQLVNGIGKITLVNPPCFELGCESGSCVANPVHWVEYAVLTHESDLERSYLARRRLSLNDGSPLPNSELVIADYIVDFQVWGHFDTRGQSSNNIGERALANVPNIPADLISKDDRGNWDVEQPETQRFEFWAHRLRGLNVMLAARAARVDPKLTLNLNLAGMGSQERSSILIERSPETGRAYVSTLLGSVDTPNLYRGD
jgi:prepilin-type N-terminal cleavage/methylation domain-containing protein